MPSTLPGADPGESGRGPVPDVRHTRRYLHPLLRYILIRIGLGVVLVFGVTLVTFSLTNLVPGDPVQAVLGEQASANPEIVRQFRADMGLDKPLPVQYAIYIGNLLQGDLGVSAQTKTPVASDLAVAFPATVELAVAAIVVSVFIGIGLGMWGALRRGRITDHVIRIVSLIGISIPTFWLALVVYYVFFFKLHALPGSGRLSPITIPPPNVTGFYTIDSLIAGQWGTFMDALGHLVLPASVLALFTIGLLTRFARSSVLEVLNMDYVRAARAKGLPSRAVVMRYVLRGALVPIITVVGISFGSLLSGAVLTEEVFSWHGIGQYAYNGATHLDLPVVMGVGLIVGVIYILVNLIVDVIYGFIDPRVRNP
jgi:peptide/nickel transport system permease protein